MPALSSNLLENIIDGIQEPLDHGLEVALDAVPPLVVQTSGALMEQVPAKVDDLQKPVATQTFAAIL